MVTSAALMTLGIGISLMIYIYFCEYDITFFCIFIVGIGMSWCILAILHCVFEDKVPIHIFYCTFCVLIPSIYLTVESHLATNRKPYTVNEDNYILGAIIIYLDLFMIFI